MYSIEKLSEFMKNSRQNVMKIEQFLYNLKQTAYE